MIRVPPVRPVLPPLPRRLLNVAALVGVVALVQPGHAQAPPDLPPYEDSAPAATDWSDSIPAHISIVDGAASLVRDGQTEPAEENMPLLAGDRLRTARGRVEVLFADASALHIDEYTELDLLSDSLVRLGQGSVRLTIARGAAGLEYRVDGAGATAWIRTAGEYRVSLLDSPTELRLTVRRGYAELQSPSGRTLVRAGFEARTSPQTAPSLPYAVSAAGIDAFDWWADTQRDARLGATSATYLPADLRHYGGALDRHGAWQYQAPYGYVWYPRVASDWRPYYDGYWSVVGPYGWIWIGASRWSWPTHHYGRWGVTAGRWYWIPDRRWAPAWVAWSSAPGYIGWSPLGFDGRPIVSVVNISVSFGRPYHGWTVVPSRVFGRSGIVRPRTLALRSWTLPRATRFALHADVPVRPPVVRNDWRPVRSPTVDARRTAVPRGGEGNRVAQPRAVSSERWGRAPVSAAPAGGSQRPSSVNREQPRSRTVTAPASSSRAPQRPVPAARPPSRAGTAPAAGQRSQPAQPARVGPRSPSRTGAPPAPPATSARPRSRAAEPPGAPASGASSWRRGAPPAVQPAAPALRAGWSAPKVDRPRAVPPASRERSSGTTTVSPGPRARPRASEGRPATGGVSASRPPASPSPAPSVAPRSRAGAGERRAAPAEGRTAPAETRPGRRAAPRER